MPTAFRTEQGPNVTLTPAGVAGLASVRADFDANRRIAIPAASFVPSVTTTATLEAFSSINRSSAAWQFANTSTQEMVIVSSLAPGLWANKTANVSFALSAPGLGSQGPFRVVYHFNGLTGAQTVASVSSEDVGVTTIVGFTGVTIPGFSAILGIALGRDSGHAGDTETAGLNFEYAVVELV